MPKAPAPLWHQRSGQDLDAFVDASINLAGGKPDATGKYGDCVIAKLVDFCGHIPDANTKVKSECWTQNETGEKCEVHEVIRQLYNATYRKKVSLPWPAIVKADDGTWQIHYAVSSKTAAKKHLLNTYGSDRSNWAYDPREVLNKKDKKS